jgi:hypothetical protein
LSSTGEPSLPRRGGIFCLGPADKRVHERILLPSESSCWRCPPPACCAVPALLTAAATTGTAAAMAAALRFQHAAPRRVYAASPRAPRAAGPLPAHRPCAAPPLMPIGLAG